jgi:ATP-dependent DNA helicase PIF1
MAVAAGWYTDPWGQAALRWWDGMQWTGFTDCAPADLKSAPPVGAELLRPRNIANPDSAPVSARDASTTTTAKASFNAGSSKSAGGIVLTEEFERALELLAGGRHVFLTGKAGTGKSTLIRRFMSSTDRNVVVIAPTGIAALNVGGYTIHRLFGFRATTTLEDVRRGDYRPGRFTKTVAALDTLIIDEASMVRADLFDMLAAALERFGPEPGKPFGGVQVVLVGDLYQLPPVVSEAEADYFTTRYETPYFFSADTFQRDQFPTIALTTVFRQLGDDQMTSILNDVREGVLVGHAHDQLNARTDPDFIPPEDEFWLTLATTNRIVSARNRQHLERLPGDEFANYARQSGDLSLFEPPVDEVLHFKIGAQVMMLNNDQSDRWVNGTIGRITDIGNGDRVSVTVEFTNGDIEEVSPYTWEATRPVIEGGSLRHEVVGSYTQLPFKLAWAITIHKSQGQTLERLVVDLTGGTFSFGQLYVALSRCTSMSGLVLKRPVLPKDLKTDRRIARFLNAAVSSSHARRLCAIAILTVGAEGRMSRPRPVELAVAFDDGTAVSTVINPQRDLADSRQAYGITACDVLLAPTLAEAWSVIGPMLTGCTPVSIGVDETLGLIDFELKRLGQVTPMPLGVDLPITAFDLEGRHALSSGTALWRASAMLNAAVNLELVDPGSTAFGDLEQTATRGGLLISRSRGTATPESVNLPALSALLEVSRRLGPVLLGEETAADARARQSVPDTSWNLAARHTVAGQLRSAAARVKLTDESIVRLREAEKLLGVEILDSATELPADGADIRLLLVPGARVCFTGTARNAAGKALSRDDIEGIATAAGLVPVKSVTKTKCDVLVVAEAGTQSGKAGKAHEFGKPVFCADEFLAWADSRHTLTH